MVNYTPELLKDFNDLLQDFAFFMSLNLIHMDKGLPPDHAAKMHELIAYSVKQCTTFNSLLKVPLLAHEAYNKDKLLKNFARLMKFFYEYLLYVEPVLKTCKPDVYADRFTKLKTHYTNFCAKYPK